MLNGVADSMWESNNKGVRHPRSVCLNQELQLAQGIATLTLPPPPRLSSLLQKLFKDMEKTLPSSE